jgi:hypothetical protein|tara:strand:- start:1677 stop:2111 length:435 start_codon:yes stop_codon:yes gene_type:complete
LGISVIAALALIACGSASEDDPTPAPQPSPAIEFLTVTAAPTTDAATAQSTPTHSPAAPSAQMNDAGGMSLTITGGIARYRVNEQLARRDLPNDAIGETTDVAGSIAFDPDGAIRTAESALIIDLTTLKSDESRRDSYVRDRTI